MKVSSEISAGADAASYLSQINMTLPTERPFEGENRFFTPKKATFLSLALSVITCNLNGQVNHAQYPMTSTADSELLKMIDFQVFK
jgi:hypothetical protein